MLKTKQFSIFTVVVFSLVVLGHLLRIIYDWELMVGGVQIPMWISWAAVLIGGYLDYQGFKISRK